MRKNIFLLVLLFCISGVYAQVERSRKIVILSGEQYYEHKVEAKQTMYAISKAYGVSINKILHWNMKDTPELKEGEILYIPYAEYTTVLQSIRYKHYIVKKGDTLYSLAKKFKTTEQELITLNAGVEVALVEGRRLIVPLVSENQPHYDSNYYYHIVQDKETLSSIARRYSISVGKLKKVNEEINPKYLKPNDEVRIPIKYASAEVANIRMINKKTKEQKEVLVVDNPLEKTQGPLTNLTTDREETVEDFSQNFSNESNEYDMLVLLPLQNSFVGLLNYYKGMLLAIEENGELPVNIYTYDTRKSGYFVKSYLQKHKKADFIVGPYLKETFSAALPFANNKTTLVSLLSKNEAVYENENVLQLNTTEYTINRRIAEYVVKEHSSDNVICFNGNTFVPYRDLNPVTDEKVQKLATFINEIQDKGNLNIKDYQEEFKKLFKPSKKNIVIVPESDYKVVNKILTALNVFSMKDIEVIGYYKWKLFSNIDPEILFNLNVTYFTPFHYLPTENVDFVTIYKECYHAYPDDFSYMGYQTMKTLLEGIKKGGKYFYKNPSQNFHKHKYGGYENLKLYKIQFRKDHKITNE